MSLHNERKPLLGKSYDDSVLGHGPSSLTKQRVRSHTKVRSAKHRPFFTLQDNGRSEAGISAKTGRLSQQAILMRTYVHSIGSHNQMDLRQSDFDALEDEYVSPTFNYKILAIDTTRRHRIHSRAQVPIFVRGVEAIDQQEQNYEFQETILMNRCIYICQVTPCTDLQALQSTEGIYSQKYDGFIVIGNEYTKPEILTNLHFNLSSKPKLFVFMKEPRPKRRTFMMAHKMRRQETKKSLPRKILKHFKRDWNCPFLQFSNFTKNKTKILSKLLEEIEKFQNRILEVPKPCWQKFVTFFADKDELNSYVMASILRILIILHMIISTLNLFVALEFGNTLTPKQLDSSPVVIFTSLFAFFGFLISSIAYYGLQRMSKEYLKLFEVGAILTLIWSLISIIDTIVPFLEREPETAIRWNSIYFTPINIVILILALLLSRHEVKRYNALRGARDQIYLQRILASKNFKQTSPSLHGSQSSSDQEPASFTPSGGGTLSKQRSLGERHSSHGSSADLFPQTFGLAKQTFIKE